MIGSLSSGSLASWMSLGGTQSTEKTRPSGPPPEARAAGSILSAFDQDRSGGLDTSELQSFVDGLDDQTRSALLSLQEDSSSSDTSSTSSTSSSDLASQLMSALDEDGDGSVSGDELQSFLEANRPPPPPPPGETQNASATSTTSDTSSSTTGQDAASSSDTSNWSAMLAQMLMQSYGQMSNQLAQTGLQAFDTAA